MKRLHKRIKSTEAPYIDLCGVVGGGRLFELKPA